MINEARSIHVNEVNCVAYCLLFNHGWCVSVKRHSSLTNVQSIYMDNLLKVVEKVKAVKDCMSDYSKSIASSVQLRLKSQPWYISRKLLFHPLHLGGFPSLNSNIRSMRSNSSRHICRNDQSRAQLIDRFLQTYIPHPHPPPRIATGESGAIIISSTLRCKKSILWLR